MTLSRFTKRLHEFTPNVFVFMFFFSLPIGRVQSPVCQKKFLSFPRKARLSSAAGLMMFGSVKTGCTAKKGRSSRTGHFLVNLFLTKFVRISGFSSLFSAIAVFLSTFVGGYKKKRSLRKERKPQKS